MSYLDRLWGPQNNLDVGIVKIRRQLNDAGLYNFHIADAGMADQLTLSQPGGKDYAHLIITGTPGFSDLPTALQ